MSAYWFGESNMSSVLMKLGTIHFWSAPVTALTRHCDIFLTCSMVSEEWHTECILISCHVVQPSFPTRTMCDTKGKSRLHGRSFHGCCDATKMLVISDLIIVAVLEIELLRSLHGNASTDRSTRSKICNTASCHEMHHSLAFQHAQHALRQLQEPAT